MIYDNLENGKFYNLGPVWQELMTWLAAQTVDSIYESTVVAGCHIGFTNRDTKTFESCLFESHRLMADIHVVLEGEEWMYVTPVKDLPLQDPFDETKDLGFHVAPQCEPSKIALLPGDFIFVMPWEAHMPIVAPHDKPAPIRKLVVKIPVEKLQA